MVRAMGPPGEGEGERAAAQLHDTIQWTFLHPYLFLFLKFVKSYNAPQLLRSV